MRLRATNAGVEPIVGKRQVAAQPARRNWLKRLGAVLTGAIVATPALASPRQVTGADPYLGEIMLFGGTFAPQGWAFCDGRLLDISQNSALFALIGTTYGGNGTTNFAVPDLRGRAPRHFHQGIGLSSYTLGQMGGAETQTLTTAQIPAHTHALQASTVPTSNSPVGNVPATQAGTDVNGETVSVLAFGPPPPTDPAHASTIQAVGGGQPIGTMPISLVVNYCIALEGIFPSQ
jgi:microcystin-dependent protein